MKILQYSLKFLFVYLFSIIYCLKASDILIIQSSDNSSCVEIKKQPTVRIISGESQVNSSSSLRSNSSKINSNSENPFSSNNTNQTNSNSQNPQNVNILNSNLINTPAKPNLLFRQAQTVIGSNRTLQNSPLIFNQIPVNSTLNDVSANTNLLNQGFINNSSTQRNQLENSISILNIKIDLISQQQTNFNNNQINFNNQILTNLGTLENNLNLLNVNTQNLRRENGNFDILNRNRYNNLKRAINLVNNNIKNDFVQIRQEITALNNNIQNINFLPASINPQIQPITSREKIQKKNYFKFK